MVNRHEPDGGVDGPPGDYIDVDVDSLAAAGVELGEMGNTLTDAVAELVPGVADVLRALPQSDLYNAYVFCWGRWSAVLDTAGVALAEAGQVAKDAAAGYRRTDKRFTPQ
jgi:hypothetical protein